MKIFFSENNVDYKSYTFSYAIYAVREGLEDFSPIYQQGFLPYSANTQLSAEVFYHARSLRVDLASFEDTSENRRVNRQMEPLVIELAIIDKNNFDLNDPAFKSFCTKYINERIGDENMSAERLDYILSRPLATHLLKFSNKNQVMGYVLAALNEQMLHYWFAFFDTEYMKTHSLGKWIMWKTISHAKAMGLRNVYLGTAYKPAALYKIRDHKGLEFWDGHRWNNDMKLLKNLCQADGEQLPADRFKLSENQNEFILTL